MFFFKLSDYKVHHKKNDMET